MYTRGLSPSCCLPTIYRSRHLFLISSRTEHVEGSPDIFFFSLFLLFKIKKNKFDETREMLRPTRGIYEKIHTHKTTTTHTKVWRNIQKNKYKQIPFVSCKRYSSPRENVVQTDQYETTTTPTTLVVVVRDGGRQAQKIYKTNKTPSPFSILFSHIVKRKYSSPTPLQDTI